MRLDGIVFDRDIGPHTAAISSSLVTSSPFASASTDRMAKALGFTGTGRPRSRSWRWRIQYEPSDLVLPDIHCAITPL
jgi:hypothetical protein